VLQHAQRVHERHALTTRRRVEVREHRVGRRGPCHPVGEQSDGRHGDAQQFGGRDTQQDIAPPVERRTTGPVPAGRAARVRHRTDLRQACVAQPRLDDECPAAVVVEPLPDRFLTAAHQVERLRGAAFVDEWSRQHDPDAPGDLVPFRDHQLVREVAHRAALLTCRFPNARISIS
jgi:hypothetical protein